MPFCGKPRHRLGVIINLIDDIYIANNAFVWSTASVWQRSPDWGFIKVIIQFLSLSAESRGRGA